MKVDVAILGGGLAGLALARQLARELPRAEVVVIERRPFPVPERTHKVGESLVELGAGYLRDGLGLAEHLEAGHVPKLGLRFFFRGEAAQPIAERLEYGVFHPPGLAPDAPFEGLLVPSHQIDRGRLENHLAALARDRLVARRVEAVELGRPHRVRLEGDEAIEARWVIDATGRRRLLARQERLARALPHRARALWARVGARLAVEDWSDALGPRMVRPGLRPLSTNHLVGPGYWVWLIPLPEGATSVGVMSDPDLAPIEPRASMDALLAFLRPREPELAEALARAPVDDVRFLDGEAYDAEQVFSRDRWALAGEAALYLDPLYSPGADFIAIGNTMIARMIEADLAGRPLAGLARTSELVFRQLVDGYLDQYRGAYALLGSPAAMLHKVVWDSALYFGTHALLFRNGALGDPAALAALRPELERARRAHSTSQAMLRSIAARDRVSRPGWVEHGEVPILYDLYARLAPALGPRELGRALGEHVARLEGFSREVLRPVAGGAPTTLPIRGAA